MSEEVTAEQTNEETAKPAVESNPFESWKEKQKSFSEPKEEDLKPSEKKSPDKTATPEKEAVKKQGESEEGTPKKEPETEEKRLKDKDRYITKLEEERKELKLTVAKMNKLINKYGSDAVVYDENGDPVGFNFETNKETPKKTAEESDPEPPEPNEDDDIKTFNKKLKDHIKWELRQEARQKEEAKAKENEAKEQLEQETLREQVFKEAVNEDLASVIELFPDAQNKESELYKKANEIYQKDIKRLSLRSDVNSYCFFRAADALGLKPVTESKDPEKKEVKITLKKNLMDLGSQGGKDSLNMDSGFLKWKKEQERFKSSD